MSSSRVVRHSWTVALVILLVSAGTAPAQTKPPVATAAEELSRSTEALARAASDLVTTRRASGSGVIVAPDGYIVTKSPVRSGCRSISRCR